MRILSRDSSTSDNDYQIGIGYTDVKVLCSQRWQEEATWLDLSVLNDSDIASDVTLNIRGDKEDGEILYSEELGEIAGGKGVSMTVNLRPYEDSCCTYFVEAVTGTEDVVEGNNTVFVYTGFGTDVPSGVLAPDPKFYTVNFQIGGGSAVESQQVEEGRGAMEPQVPSREGYRFIGWYFHGEPYNFRLPVMGDITLEAVWEEQPVLAAPSASFPTGSEVEVGTKIVLTCAASGAEIYYTLDGTVPVGLWIAGVDERGYTYTGKAIKPAVRVYDNKTRLREKTDYSISYKNNTKVSDGSAANKAPSIVVTGKGNYAGKETANFKILPQNIAAENIKAEDIAVIYNKKVQRAVPVLLWNGRKLKNKTDYIVEYPDLAGNPNAYQAPGTYSILVKGRGCYGGERKLSLVVTQGKLMSRVKVSKIAPQPYTGRKITIAAMDKAPVVKSGGTLMKKFRITPYDIQLDPEKRIRAVIVGQPVYAKGGSRPEPVVKFGNTILEKGKDYTLSYQNNRAVNPGKDTNKRPIVIIKGRGNFKGSTAVTYSIAEQDIRNLKMTVPDKMYRNKRDSYQSVPKVTDLDGKVLKAGTDYEKDVLYCYGQDIRLSDGSVGRKGKPIGAADILPAGTVVEVTVTGKGNYKGVLTGRYRVAAISISGAKVTAAPQTYSGREIILDKSQLTVKVGRNTLSPGDYEIVEDSYRNNVKKGTASVIIRGTGNYGGTKTVKFKIRAKNMFWWWRK